MGKVSAVIVVLMLAVLSISCWAQEKTATGFCYPTGKSQFQILGCGWFGARDVDGYRPMGVWHCGSDIAGNLGDRVVAVADGKVVAISQGGWSDNDSKPDNFAYLILHTLDNGEKFVAIYGHLQRPATLKVGAIVSAGQELGLIGRWQYGTHLHFGIYQDRSHPSSGSFPNSGLGRQPNPRPELKVVGGVNAYSNWFDSIQFLRERTPVGKGSSGTPDKPADQPKPSQPKEKDKTLSNALNKLSGKIKLPDILIPSPAGKAKADTPDRSSVPPDVVTSGTGYLGLIGLDYNGVLAKMKRQPDTTFKSTESSTMDWRYNNKPIPGYTLQVEFNHYVHLGCNETFKIVHSVDAFCEDEKMRVPPQKIVPADILNSKPREILWANLVENNEIVVMWVKDDHMYFLNLTDSKKKLVEIRQVLNSEGLLVEKLCIKPAGKDFRHCDQTIFFVCVDDRKFDPFAPNGNIKGPGDPTGFVAWGSVGSIVRRFDN